ncbi:amino acid kinase family protein [Oryzibacter oryziterrae]|uniref:amino acid kinase family protein n=1 Tax=Oryzibacter oryziterrae TaxID=2766474 RepID=UPI001F38C3CE|nr:uridylate kinase [Oryzibacter oryziterrae]
MAPVPFSRTGNLVIVKIGGSLATDRVALHGIIGDIGRAACRSVIVPGGGAFADAVRSVQAGLGFSDKLAHRLAMQAMSDYADVLAELYPQLVVTRLKYEIEAAHHAGRIPVWSPAVLEAGVAGLPENWTITSDSLAAFLARSLRASALLLIKSVDGPDLASATHLTSAGLTDDAFPDFAGALDCPVRLIGPANHGRLSELLARPDKTIGTVVPQSSLPH